MLDVVRIFQAIRAERRGVTAVEYGIMAALISAVLVTAVTTMTKGYPKVFSRIAGYLT